MQVVTGAITGTPEIPVEERECFEAELRARHTLGDVVDWLRGQSPPRNVTEILTQDEYTHDVVVEWTPQRFLVFDVT